MKYAILPILLCATFAHAHYTTNSGYAAGNNNSNPAYAGDLSIAIGSNSRAIPSFAVAIGNNSRAGIYTINTFEALDKEHETYDGVALGSNSYSYRVGSIDGYLKPTNITPDIYTPYNKTNPQHSTWNATAGAVSIGNDRRHLDVLDLPKITRQLIGVAAGSEDTDAVNVAQLKELEKKMTTTINVNNQTIKLPDFRSMIETLEMEVEPFSQNSGLPTRANNKITLKEVLTEQRNAINILNTNVLNTSSQDNTINKIKSEFEKSQIDYANHKTDFNEFKIKTTNNFNEQNIAINGLEQKIQNVETTINQRIDGIDGKLKSGIANTVAMANLPQNIISGGTTISTAVGGYDGANAIALGLSGSNSTGQIVFKGSASISLGNKENNGRKVSYGVGVGYTF